MAKKIKKSGNLWTIEGLVVKCPDLNLKEKMMLFGQFIGDWEIEDRFTQEDGTEVEMKGEVHFGWILD